MFYALERKITHHKNRQAGFQGQDNLKFLQWTV